MRIADNARVLTRSRDARYLNFFQLILRAVRDLRSDAPLLMRETAKAHRGADVSTLVIRSPHSQHVTKARSKGYLPLVILSNKQ